LDVHREPNVEAEYLTRRFLRNEASFGSNSSVTELALLSLEHTFFGFSAITHLSNSQTKAIALAQSPPLHCHKLGACGINSQKPSAFITTCKGF
jgi:hypothetical protein